MINRQMYSTILCTCRLVPWSFLQQHVNYPTVSICVTHQFTEGGRKREREGEVGREREREVGGRERGRR